MGVTPQSIHILHVDDEPDLAELAAEYLTRADDRISVDTATDAKDGLDLLDENVYDCVVSDYDMPGQTGIEFLESVRQDYPDLPFILYTGKGSEEVASEAISAGVTDYLQKESGTDHYAVLANRIHNVVEAKRFARQADKREHRLKQILKAVPACVVRIDYDGQFVYANQRAKDVLGLKPADVAERTYNDPEWKITDLEGEPIPDDELPFRQVRDSGEPIYGFRHKIEWPDGTRKALQVDGAPLFDDEGRVQSTVFALSDITEQHEREENMRQLKEEFETVFNNAQDALFLFDVVVTDAQYEFELRRLNPAHEEMTGLSSEELRGATPREIIGEEQGAEVAANLRECVEAEEPIFYEEVLEMPSGTFNWQTKLAPVFNDGEVTQIVGLARDITEQKERQERLDAIFNQTYQFTGLLEPDGTLIEANETALQFGGLERDDVIGKKMWDAEWFQHSEETRERAKNAVEKAATGEFVRHELAVQGADAEEVIIDFSVRPITDDRGEVTLLIPEGRDISHRKDREEAVEQLHAATRDLMAATTKGEVLETGSETAEAVLGLPLNGIHLYDQDEEALIPVAWTEQSERLLDDIPPEIPIEDSLAGQAYRTGEPGLYSDVQEEDETLNPATPIRSELHLPLGQHGVFMAGSTTPDDFDANDAALAQILAANIESALDRVEREEDLARQQSLLEAQQEAVLDGMLVTDDDRQIISYNDRFVELWDIPAEIVERGEDDRVIEVASDHFANPDEFQDRIDYLYEHPEETTQEEVELADGRVFERYTTPLIGEDGTHYGRLWTFRDITDRKERIREIERERNRFEAVFETVPDPTVHVVFEGSDPVIQHVNDAFEEVFGYGPEEARGELVDDLIVPGDQQAEAADINESVREAGLLQSEIKRETVTGERPFLFTAQTMALGDGDRERVEGVGTYVDLTEQKRRENELTRQNERLNEFASMVSHDLRNPLRVAEGNLELALEEPERAPIESAVEALGRMDDLIEDMLALARQGQPIDEIEEVQLASVVERCWAMVESGETDLEIEGELTFRADPDRVQQLIENLLRNAIDHGGRDVSLRVGVLDSRDGFYVADDGPGIPEEARAQVFESAYTTGDDGTGFGLAIVDEIVEAHGWEIEVAASNTGGTRFEITGVELVND